MFSKLMKKTIAVAAVAAMTSVMAAVATPWWTIDFDSYTDGAKVSASTETKGTWTQHEDDLSVVTKKEDGNVLSLNTQGEDLIWTPNAPAESYDSVILDAEVTFVASDVEPTTDDSMQTAIYLKATDEGDVLCAYQATEAGKAWVAKKDFKIDNGDTKKVTITIDYSDETPMVTLTIGDTSVEYPVANVADKVSSVAFRGTGVVDNFKAQTSVNVTYVADVDGVPFETYAAALEYLKDNGGTLKITGDSADLGTFTFDKNVDVTIDLGGKEITAAFVVDGGANLTIDNGTVNAPMGSDVIAIYDGTAVVGANATLYASDNCVVYLNDATPTSELNLVVSGNLYVTNDTGYAAIYGNGLNEAESNIEIKDGAVVSHDYDLAIYHAQVGTLTIGYATIVGTTAIEMRAGNLIVNEDAFIEGTADFSATPNGNGSTVLGAAIALSQHTTQKPTTVTVNGGTLKGDRAFYQDNLASGTSTSVSATIAAGTTLDGAIEVAEEGFAMPKADDGSYTLASGVAIVGNNVYETLAYAVAAAAAGDTVTLLTDVTTAQTIAIDKDITIDGNGKTLTYTGKDRAITVESSANGADLTVKNLTVDCTASYCQRGINYNTNGKLTLEGVTVKGKNVTYAVNLPGSSDGAEVTITDSDLSGNIALNVWGENAVVNVENTNLTAIDNNSSEGYATVKLNNDGVTAAEGTVINITGGKIDVTGTASDDTEAVSNATSTGEIIISDSTSINGVVATMVAVIRYENGTSYSFTSLEEAIAAAKAGDTVTLLRDVSATEIIAIEKGITLDGNGYTLTSTAARAINIDGADGATIENLTIVAEGERGINLINGATNVTITDVDVTAKNYAVNLAASASGAVVTITDSTLTGLNAFNAGAANAEVTIAGSEIYCNDNSANESYGAISLNQDAAGTKVVVTDSQFYIKGDSFVATNSASGKGATITINGSTEAVENMVAAIDCAGGYSKVFTSLADAFADADAGETVKLIANATEDVTIAATATLDLNGYGATGTFTLTDAAAKLNAAEGLNVVTNVEGYEVVFADGCYSVQKQVVEVEFAPVKTTSIVIDGTTAKLTIGGEYTEVKVYFKETLDAEWTEVVEAKFADSVITVPATTATGFFTVHAR